MRVRKLVHLMGCAVLDSTPHAFATRPGPQLSSHCPSAPVPLPLGRARSFTCWPDARGCTPIYDYKRLVVSEHGSIRGAEAMKAEIRARGPISCSIYASDRLDAYTGGFVLASQFSALSMCVTASQNAPSWAAPHTARHGRQGRRPSPALPRFG